MSRNSLLEAGAKSEVSDLASLAKLLSVPLRNKWFCVRVQLQSGKSDIYNLVQNSD